MADILFPTDNAWGIPTLNLRTMAHNLDAPFIAWGSIARSSRMPGTWHFYTDDYRFRALLTRPDAPIQTGCVSCVEPNFTLSDQMPAAVALYRIYQKRWIASLWQSSGIHIIADLNVPPRWRDINFIGIPRGWTAYATHGYSDRIDDTIIDFQKARQHAGDTQILFIVYGGGADVAAAATDNNWLWIPERADTINKKEL